jgi:hypothetical protein
MTNRQEEEHNNNRIKERQQEIEDFQFAVELLLEEEREFNREKMRKHGYNPYAVY